MDKLILRLASYKSEFIWFGLAQVVTLIAPLAFIRLYSNKLEPEVFGELSLWLAICVGVSLITYSPNCASAVKFISESSDSELSIKAYVDALYRINQKHTGFAAFILLVIGLFLFLLHKEPGSLVSASASIAYFAAQSSFTLRYSIANALRHRKLAFIIAAIELIPRYILSAFCISILSGSVLVAFAAIAIWSPFSLQLFRLISSRKYTLANTHRQDSINVVVPSTRIDEASLKIKTYSRPLKYSGIAGFIQSLSDSFVLLFFHGPTAVAAFGILLKAVYTPLSYGIAQLISFTEPLVFSKYAKRAQSSSIGLLSIKPSVIYVITLFTIVSLLLGIHLLGFKFIETVSERKFASILYSSAPYIGISALLFCFSQFQALVITAVRGPRICLAPRLFYSSVLIGLNIVLGQYYSVLGLAISYLVASILFFVLIQLVYLRTLDKL